MGEGLSASELGGVWLWVHGLSTSFSESGGVHPLGRHPSQRQTPPKTATAVDGMHPTGMHPFVGPQITLFWTSGDASSGSQSQNRQPYLHLAEA